MARVTSKVMLGSGSIDNFKEYAAEIPLSVIDEMLISEADVVESEVKSNAQTMLKGDYYTGGTADALFRKDPHNSESGKSKGNRQITLTFNEKRYDKYHQSGERNGTIAFVNEYGARGIPARPFIQKAIDNKEKQAFDSAEKVFDKWLQKEKM